MPFRWFKAHAVRTQRYQRGDPMKLNAHFNKVATKKVKMKTPSWGVVNEVGDDVQLLEMQRQRRNVQEPDQSFLCRNNNAVFQKKHQVVKDTDANSDKIEIETVNGVDSFY